MDISSYTITAIERLLKSEKPSPDLLKAMENDRRSGVVKLLERYCREQERLAKIREKAEMMITEEKMLWEKGYKLVGGIDEAGRGPLAGPVVAACVILPPGLVIEGIDDSKKLTSAKREELYDIIMESAVSAGIGIADNNTIDKINIFQAAKEAMIKACTMCRRDPDYLLIDAMALNEIPIPQKSIVGGDAKSQSIAAASIIAKVYRDREMEKMDLKYPGYGFAKHKGYGTEEHIKAIKTLGLSPIHRRSFTHHIFGG